MKKLIALAVMGLFTTGLFAGGSVLSDENLKEADKVGQKINVQKEKQATLSSLPVKTGFKTVKVLGEYENLVKILSSKEYNTGFIFQGIANVMDAWNDAKKTEKAAGLANIAAIINAPIPTGYSNSQFVMSDFINMESCVIASRSPKFAQELEAFGEEVKAAAAKAGMTKEEEFVLGSLENFKRVAGNLKSYNANYLLQAVTGIMDSWNDAKKVLPKEKMVKLAKEIDQPVSTGFGTKVIPSSFAYTEACVISSRSPQLGAEIEAFGAEVMNLAK